jgi:hypothetical protein
MALGPKEMNAAIVANLKSKSGKNLEEWKAQIKGSGLAIKKEIHAWLKSQGLGHIQAQVVTNHYLGTNLYNEKKDQDTLFTRYPDQRKLLDKITQTLKEEFSLTPKPCKGYIPLYNPQGTISISFKPTAKGLYAGLIGEEFPFPVVPHKKTLGGSERMKFEFYLVDEEADPQKVFLALQKKPMICGLTTGGFFVWPVTMRGIGPGAYENHAC